MGFAFKHKGDIQVLGFHYHFLHYCALRKFITLNNTWLICEYGTFQGMCVF